MIHSFDDLTLFLEEEGFVYYGNYSNEFIKKTNKGYATIKPFYDSNIIDSFYEDEHIPNKHEHRFVRIGFWGWDRSLIRVDELVNYTNNKIMVDCIVKNSEYLISEIEEHMEKYENKYVEKFRKQQERTKREEYCIEYITSTTPFSFYSNPDKFLNFWFDLDGVFSCFRFNLDSDKNGRFLSIVYKVNRVIL